MKSDLIYRTYARGEEEEIVNLLDVGYEGWPKFDLSCSKAEHWGWKYVDNPVKWQFIVVAESERGVVGVSHSVPVTMKLGDRLHLCCCGTDLAVHPDLRGGGIYTAMDQLKTVLLREKGVAMDCGVSWNPFVIRHWKKIGRLKFPHTIANLVRIRDIDVHMRNIPEKHPLVVKTGFHSLKLINSVKSFFRRKSFQKSIETREMSSFDERLNALWDDISKHYDFAVERSVDYLNWRYCDDRAGKYTKIVGEGDDSQVLGYIVLRINKYREDYPVGYIVDLGSHPHRPEVAYRLIEEAVQFFDNSNLNIINCLTVKGHSYESILNMFGFLDSMRRPMISYRPFECLELFENIGMIPSDKILVTYGDMFII